MGADFFAFFKWWTVILILGAGFYPLASYIFRSFRDRGYIFGKALGILIPGYAVWILCSFHISRFRTPAVWLITILCIAVCWGIPFYLNKRNKSEKRAFIKDIPYRTIITEEALFFLCFLVFTFIKAHNPDAYGTEKMMDYGFMTSMYNTDYFPVNDFWFTGESLNYYYFGQYLMTYITKLSFNVVAYGYNLAIGMGFAICLMLSGALGYQVMFSYITASKGKVSRQGRRVSGFAALLSALAVTIAGNVHYIIFCKFVPMLWDILQIPGDKPSYWFPNSTRYIGYMPDVGDKTIHEFPAYSFILGDLHAHVINITFVLTLLGVLFSFVMEKRQAHRKAVTENEALKRDFKKECLNGNIILLGFLIGSFMMTNYWDFPIYYVVSGAVILFINLIIYRYGLDAYIITALQGLEIIAVAFITALPFNVHFNKMESGIAFSEKHTLFYQYVILWGLPIAVVLALFVSLILRTRADKKKGIGGFLEEMKLSELYTLLLGLCAMGLLLIPEVIYVVDIYGGDYKRSNTMFKMTYQAFMLFGIVMGFVITKFIFYKEARWQKKFAFIAGFILLWTCGYFFHSSKAWFGNVFAKNEYDGLKGDQYIYREQPYDAAAIDWIIGNTDKNAVILEANGDSYTIYDRVSTLTGRSTVLGWFVHEWLWHNDPEPGNARVTDVATVYTSNDMAAVNAVINKYGIDYIFLGTCEYEKFGEAGLNVEQILSLGDVVFEGETDSNARKVYVVKVGG